MGGGAGGPGGGAAPASSLGFSEDSKWVAFMVYPTRAEGQRLRRQRRPVQAKVQLLDLASGKDVTIENVRRFAFAGERGGWVALQKAPASGGGPGAGAGAAPTPAPGGAPGGSAGAASDRPRGADLILRDLATGRDLNIGNVAEFAFDKSGQLPGARHRRARQGRQRRAAPEHGIGRRLRARQRQGLLRAPRVDREGRRPLRSEGHRRQAVHGQGLRGHRLLGLRGGWRAAARDVRPGVGQDLPRGHVHQPRPAARRGRKT